MKKPRRLRPVKERLAEKYSVNGSGCWVWHATLHPGGYGKMYFNGKVCLAHRISYEVYVGPIPEGLCIDHLCRNRACVNPEHLEPVTHHVNNMRGHFGTTKVCPKGHEYSGDNLVYTKYGSRNCRQCSRLSGERTRERNKISQKVISVGKHYAGYVSAEKGVRARLQVFSSGENATKEFSKSHVRILSNMIGWASR